MEAESAFPSPISDFEAERFTSGVELPQSQTHKFEDLGIAEGDVDCAPASGHDTFVCIYISNNKLGFQVQFQKPAHS